VGGGGGGEHRKDPYGTPRPLRDETQQELVPAALNGGSTTIVFLCWAPPSCKKRTIISEKPMSTDANVLRRTGLEPAQETSVGASNFLGEKKDSTRGKKKHEKMVSLELLLPLRRGPRTSAAVPATKKKMCCERASSEEKGALRKNLSISPGKTWGGEESGEVG